MNHKIKKRLERLYSYLERNGESGSANLLKLSLYKPFENLRRGSRGPSVIRAQKALISKGFQLPRFGADGVFGEETEVAVKDFQSKNNLNPDGIIGKLTISKLDPSTMLETSTFSETKKEVEEKPKASYSAKRYEPFSIEAKKLFQEASRIAGVPTEWALSEGLHQILKRESDGWVGRPNYTYGAREADPSFWGQIHEELRENKLTTRSSATGLGQLLTRNVDKYYPSGRAGIGDPLEEAVGMLSYIKDRYQSPEKAWNMYGSVEKTDPDTGSVFTEGY
jgi:peptidoglycan hydrolase-like protein with peptidoglycan-binding domain